jgi:hypothetical protein
VLFTAATVEAARAAQVQLPDLRPVPPLKTRGVRAPLEAFCFPDDGFSHQIRMPEMGESSQD